MSRLIAGVGVVALLALGAAGGGWSDRVAVPIPAEKIIESWPSGARSAARITMARYGMPDEVGEDALVWHANGPWKTTTVHRRAGSRFAFWSEKAYLENALGYDVPTRSLEDLAFFDERLAVDPALAWLSARTGNEAMNYLVLNLADEIINGKRTVLEAQAFQDQILRLEDAGKSSPYLKGLLFERTATRR